MLDRAKFMTEQRNPRTASIDTCSSLEIVDIINAEDRTVAERVHEQCSALARAIDVVVEAFQAGGRLFYVGAGTSGRLGVLDAAECPPTFGVEPSLVQGIIAGGHPALVRAVEGLEDHEEYGAQAVDERGIAEPDVLMGIATSGATPYVQGALRRAQEVGAATIFFTCNPNVEVPVQADLEIRIATGPEVITGSTRMKAGTATKLVLNTITTGAMIRTGRVYGNLMVDLRASNEKLRDRARRIIHSVTGIEGDAAQALIDAAQGRVKTAIVMHLCGVDRAEAERRLDAAGGFVRRAIEQG